MDRTPHYIIYCLIIVSVHNFFSCSRENFPPSFKGVRGYAVHPYITPHDTLRKWLDDFRKTGATLTLAIRQEDIDRRDPSLASLIRDAGKKHIPVRAWPLLTPENGLYPNEGNADLFSSEVKAMIDWIEAESLPIEWIVVDMEMDEKPALAMSDAFASGDLGGVITALQSNINEAAYAIAMQKYRNIIEYCHAHGVKVHGVSFPMVLDDFEDGDPDLQDAFNTPVDGLPWDAVDFMVYRTMISEIYGTPLSEDLVYQYAKAARERYGEKAYLDVGLVGWGPLGYTNVADIHKDILAAWAAGIFNIHIFSFTGILDQAHPEEWLVWPQEKDAVIPGHDTRVDLMRLAFRALDTLL